MAFLFLDCDHSWILPRNIKDKPLNAHYNLIEEYQYCIILPYNLKSCLYTVNLIHPFFYTPKTLISWLFTSFQTSQIAYFHSYLVLFTTMYFFLDGRKLNSLWCGWEESLMILCALHRHLCGKRLDGRKFGDNYALGSFHLWSDFLSHTVELPCRTVMKFVSMLWTTVCNSNTCLESQGDKLTYLSLLRKCIRPCAFLSSVELFRCQAGNTLYFSPVDVERGKSAAVRFSEVHNKLFGIIT